MAEQVREPASSLLLPDLMSPLHPRMQGAGQRPDNGHIYGSGFQAVQRFPSMTQTSQSEPQLCKCHVTNSASHGERRRNNRREKCYGDETNGGTGTGISKFIVNAGPVVTSTSPNTRGRAAPRQRSPLRAPASSQAQRFRSMMQTSQSGLQLL